MKGEQACVFLAITQRLHPAAGRLSLALAFALHELKLPCAILRPGSGGLRAAF